MNPGSGKEQFEGLLRAVMDHEFPDRQKAAEKLLNDTTNSQPNEIYNALLQVGLTPGDDGLRLFALVTLRRVLKTRNKEWKHLAPQTQQLLRVELLKGLEREQVKNIRNQIREVIQSLAEYLLDDDNSPDDGGWDELLPWIFHTITNGNEPQIESAFLLLSGLTIYLEERLSDPLSNFASAKEVLKAGLIHPNIQIAQAALGATISFVLVFIPSRPPYFRQELRALIQPILDLFSRAMQTSEEHVNETLKLMIDLVEMDAGFLKPAAPVISKVMFSLLQSAPEPTKRLALEFMLQFIENKPLVFSEIGFVKTLVDALLHLMLTKEDVSLDLWNTIPDEDEKNEVGLSDLAQIGFDRVANAMGGDILVPVVFEHLPTFLRHENWLFRYTGLIVLAVIGEGCFPILSPQISQVTDMILPAFEDPHPRVRWAAADVIGQFSVDFTSFQRKTHAKVLPQLMRLLGDSPNPKVQGHALLALINFCAKFDKSLIVPYLEPLGTQFYQLLQSKHNFVQINAVAAIAALSTCAQDGFNKYYLTFAPFLLTVLKNATGPEHKTLRARALECITIVGAAVGKEIFKQHAFEVMDILSTIPFTAEDIDDPLHQVVVKGWLRVSVCLGNDFVPYLKFVMPVLFEAASVGTRMKTQEKDADEEEGWDVVVGVGDTVGQKTYQLSRVAIHTSTLEEKASACATILHYAREVGINYLPYVKPTAELFVPFLSFFWNEGIRISAYNVMGALLTTAKQQLTTSRAAQDLQFLNELFEFVFPAMLKDIKGESDEEVIGHGLTAMGQCISVLDNDFFPEHSVQPVISTMRFLCEKMHKNMVDAVNRHRDAEDEDEFTQQCILRTELAKSENVLEEIGEVLGALVRARPGQFMQFFPEFSAILFSFAQKIAPEAERKMVLTLFVDVVENTKGNLPTELWELFVPILFECVNATDDNLRGVASIGLGCCCQHGGQRFLPYVSQALELLVNSIKVPRQKIESSLVATDDAIGAVGKILEFHPEATGNMPKLLEISNLWLSWLPLKYEELEGKQTHERLLRFVGTQNQIILGQNWSNFPRILAIFTDLLGDSLFFSQDSEVILKQILLTQLPPNLLNEASNTLDYERKAKLSKFLMN